MWRAYLVFLTIASVLAADDRDHSRARAPSHHCDRYLRVSVNDPFGYRVRGERCEGMYVQQVTRTPLVVASFGQLNLPELLASNGALLVEWATGAGDVRLRASSLKPKTYYRMDSLQPAGARSYRWPADVLAATRLTKRDIGIVAWTRQKAGNAMRDVYLPVRIGRPSAGREGIYELVLIPGSELSEVFFALTSVRNDGRREPVSKPAPLRLGSYPAGRLIRIPVGPLPHPGTYLVEIGATLRDGGAVSHELWFEQRSAR